MGVIGKIAKLYGVRAADLKKAIVDESEFELPSLIAFTKSELDKNNDSIAAKAKSDTVSSFASEFDIESGDVETIKKQLIAKYSDADSKEKNKQLTGKIKELEEQIEGSKSEYKALKSEVEFSKIIPEGYQLQKEDIKTLFAASNNVGIDENGLFLKDANGNPQLNKKQQIVRPTKEGVEEFLTQKGLTKSEPEKKDITPPKRENEGSKSGKYAHLSNMADLNKYADENNIALNSSAYNNLVASIVNENPKFGQE